MTFPDVNVLVYAFRPDVADHEKSREWLTSALDGIEPVALSEPVLIGVVRVLTHIRIFVPPESLSAAMEYVAMLIAHPNTIVIRPGARYWSIFEQLCVSAKARGNLVADAQHAALAIEHGCEFVTSDRDFARFPGLRWRGL